MVKLITYSYLRSETDISPSVENAVLDNPIKWAQDRLKFLLGRDFYDEVYGQGSTTTTTFTANNAALFDPYIKQYLAWQAYEFYITKANTYETRTGVRQFKEENSDPASDGQMNTRVKLAKEQAQFYKGEMINYIIRQQNRGSSYFPLYTCQGQNFGNGFGISSVSKTDKINVSINTRTINNGY